LFLLLTISSIPWFLVSAKDPTAAFASGFNEWAMHNVVTKDIRLSASQNTRATKMEVPYWWPVIDAQIEWQRTIGRPYWTSNLKSLSPDEVRINNEGVIVMGWIPDYPLGWARFICLGDTGSAVPTSLKNHLVEWRAVGDNGWSGVRLHH
jgi:hypothetical protein